MLSNVITKKKNLRYSLRPYALFIMIENFHVNVILIYCIFYLLYNTFTIVNYLIGSYENTKIRYIFLLSIYTYK